MDKMNEINELNEQLNRKMKVITKLLVLFFRNFRQTGHYLKKKSNNGMIYIQLKTKNKQYMNPNNHINNIIITLIIVIITIVIITLIIVII